MVGTFGVVWEVPSITKEESAWLHVDAGVRVVFVVPVALAHEAGEPDGRLPFGKFFVVVAGCELFAVETKLVGEELDVVLKDIGVSDVEEVEMGQKSRRQIH